MQFPNAVSSVLASVPPRHNRNPKQLLSNVLKAHTHCSLVSVAASLLLLLLLVACASLTNGPRWSREWLLQFVETGLRFCASSPARVSACLCGSAGERASISARPFGSAQLGGAA